MDKKTYIKPDVQIIKLDARDLIATSIMPMSDDGPEGEYRQW